MDTDNIKNKLCQWIALRIPNRLRYFVVIDAWAKATSGKYGDTDAVAIRCDEVVKRIGKY